MQAFHGKLKYLCKLSSYSRGVQTTRVTYVVKTEWTWKAEHQKLFDKSKEIIKEVACMTFYDEARLLYLETDASGFGLGAGLLQTMDRYELPTR